MSMLRIWGRANSLNVQKVLWCCTEIEVAFDRIDWAGEFGGNEDPEYRKLHPHGKVPVITDGEVVVWESNTIQRYLCQTRPGGDLIYPSQPAVRAAVESWMDWQLAGLNPPMVQLLLAHYRTPPEKRDEKAMQMARNQAQALWQTVDQQLARQAFIAGDTFSIADIGIGIQAYRWYDYPVERLPLLNLERWLDGLRQRPGFKSFVEGPIT